MVTIISIPRAVVLVKDATVTVPYSLHKIAQTCCFHPEKVSIAIGPRTLCEYIPSKDETGT